MNDVIYQYDGSLDGFLCCVYESYVYKEAPAAFCCDEDPLSLYEVRTVVTKPAYSQRVSRGIAARSGKALAVVRRGFLTCLPDKELHLYAFIRKLLAEGPGFMRDLSDPACYPLYRAIRHMNGELEKTARFCAVFGLRRYTGRGDRAQKPCAAAAARPFLPALRQRAVFYLRPHPSRAAVVRQR